MATPAMGTGAHTFSYPPDIKSEKSRQQHKLKTQKENPETLFKDTLNSRGKTITTNLLFYTEQPTAWHTASCTLFQYHTKHGICKGRQLCIYEDAEKDPENRHLTINFYQNGTVMIQGNSAALTNFEQTFHCLKDMVERDEANPCKQTHTDTPEDTDQNEPSTHDNTENRTPPETTENISLPQSTGLHNTVVQLQHSLALLEVEIVELSEQVHILSTKDTEQLREQLDQMRNQLKMSIQELKREMDTLYQDRQTLKKDLKELQQIMGKELSEMKDYMGRELACFKKELQQRDKQMENLTTQMRCLTTPVNAPKVPPPSPTPTPTHPKSSSTSPAPTKPSQPSNSQKEAGTPAASKKPEILQKNMTATTPAEKQPVKTEADIAILMDSNGKFLQGERLFPGLKTTKLWCPKTGDALRILSDSTFGTPSHIIIHTGTNDLRREQERVGQLICRVAEKATEIYPNTKITISTLLPRRDIHPDTIQRVNADISKGCARLPNVHLAHHPSITIRDLYDHVHIKKDKVNVFAKTLKDTAWGRQNTFTPLKTTQLRTYRTQNQTPSINLQTHHRERPPLAAQYQGPPQHAKIHIRIPHAPALHHHRSTPAHQQKPQFAPDHHPRHPQPQKHHSRQRSNMRNNPTSAAATSLPPAHAASGDNTPNPAPLPHSRSYAQALKGQANTLEMSEIRQLLNYISTQLTA
ncbi:uncharacterized protein LOC113067372 [Carassius auratus]|uniref:Uncharacterized protein LOC113067372 n=1 Tax=Carassius auratus TaxID=7957 RepID=A0A6P6MHQ6_CARAU|nr:uncharacterized protein LOC113067372 [Carassius auratus]XP_026095532.1 uncharacterized protein LOC113067372 [Carassius auratus]